MLSAAAVCVALVARAARRSRARRMGAARHRRHHGHADHVELWADDKASRRPGDRRGARRDAPHRRDDEHLQADQRGVQVNAKAADGPCTSARSCSICWSRPRSTRSSPTARSTSPMRASATCTTFASTCGRRGADRQGAAGGQLSARAARSQESDRAVLAEGRAHRSGRHRQGLFGGPRHRGAQIAASRGPTSRPAATAASSAIASASPGSSASAIRARARARSSPAFRWSTRRFRRPGDYERFFDEGGVRYHHIIDPHTGHSASKVRSATVIGPYATRTDGLSKTAFVLGPEKAMEIYNRIDDIDAIIVKLDGTVISAHSKGSAPPQRGAANASSGNRCATLGRRRCGRISRGNC
jgi:hypothetical protein